MIETSLKLSDELKEIARELIKEGKAKSANDLKTLLKIGFGRAILLYKEATRSED